MTPSVLTIAAAEGLQLYRRGKVRDTFALADGTLLMIATDRVSAFDVVMPTPIPDKGRILTQMSRWWFERSRHIIPNHLLPDDRSMVSADVDWNVWGPRSMRVARADRIDVECVARGYLAGSGWKEYRAAGTLGGEALPTGLGESARLPEPRFTPATKNDSGHDENITRGRLAELVGTELAGRLESITLAVYAWASGLATEAGMILADTKIELGFIDGELCLIDEVLTPDSSRLWEAAGWREGESQPAFDKQVLRDWLERSGWDKTEPGPALPEEVVMTVRARYLDAARRLCGLDLR